MNRRTLAGHAQNGGNKWNNVTDFRLAELSAGSELWTCFASQPGNVGKVLECSDVMNRMQSSEKHPCDGIKPLSAEVLS